MSVVNASRWLRSTRATYTSIVTGRFEEVLRWPINIHGSKCILLQFFYKYRMRNFRNSSGYLGVRFSRTMRKLIRRTLSSKGRQTRGRQVHAKGCNKMLLDRRGRSSRRWFDRDLIRPGEGAQIFIPCQYTHTQLSQALEIYFRRQYNSLIFLFIC